MQPGGAGTGAMHRIGAENPARQPAGAGADFNHVIAGKTAARAGNTGGEVEIEQKVLP